MKSNKVKAKKIDDIRYFDSSTRREVKGTQIKKGEFRRESLPKLASMS